MKPRLIRRDALATYLGYETPSPAFTRYVRATLGVEPVRPGVYDRHAVDAALDRLSGLTTPGAAGDPVGAWLERRRPD